MNNEHLDLTPPSIDCENCGTVTLTTDEYLYQLRQVDSPWVCPHCRFVAEWHDHMSNEWDGNIGDGSECSTDDEDKGELDMLARANTRRMALDCMDDDIPF